MSKHNQRAFTLIELLVVLALLAVLLMLAAPSFRDLQRSSQLSSHTNTLVAALHSAKNEAIKHNSPSYLQPTDGSNWAKGWIVFVDSDFDESYSVNTDTKIMEGEALPNSLALSGTGTAAGGTPYVSFDGSGYPRNKSSGPGNLTMTLKFNGLSGTEDIQNTRNIILAITGRVRSCRPASASDDNCKSSSTE
jgi:type IV fimbrial biogenesis protein FimT